VTDKIQALQQLAQRLQTSTYFKERMMLAEARNPWFTEAFVKKAVDSIATDMLAPEKLQAWLSQYQLKLVNKTVALLFAGNVPLVGFHDFLCCYLTDCRILIKLSSKDEVLFPALLKELYEVDPEAQNRVELVEKLQGFDAVIATGSDNSNRYFEYYFRDYPRVLRANRNSVAVLTGTETREQLAALADDIFLYFGFGCRNVSKLYVPVGYDFTPLMQAFESYEWLHGHSKYMNNYDYNRTILLLNNTPHLSDNKIMVLEAPRIASPIATLHYEFWHDEALLASKLKQNSDKIQCVVSGTPGKWKAASEAAFGQAQHPALSDYADGVDTLQFLLSL
jgi:hypothetical protein